MQTKWRVVPALVTMTVSSWAASAPQYDHIFLIIEENQGYHQILGNSAAPNLNRLAQTYGLATQYFSVADPSAPNYVAMLGGSYFGIADDNAYYNHTVNHSSLMSQLDTQNLTWRGYFQGMPYAGYRGICYPADATACPTSIRPTPRNTMAFHISKACRTIRRR
jgi:hypothetical protein